jgi:DNA invertase Pin-like site-specific DNA recombinase
LGKIVVEGEAPAELIGYARVSTEEQNLGMQIDALHEYGVKPELVFSEKISGASKKRPRLEAALKACRPGDKLVVWRLDRIARSLVRLLAVMQHLEDEGVEFVSLTEKIDTTTAIGKFYTQMVGAFAEFERNNAVIRTREGVKRAKENGVRFGAEKKIDLDLAKKLITEGKSIAAVAKRCKVSKATVYNWFNVHQRDALKARGKRSR